MPTYDWACEQGHRFEERAKMDQRAMPCAVCGRIARRQFTPTDPGRIRITSGFRLVTRSMVVPEKETKAWGVTPYTKRPNWVGGWGHAREASDPREKR